jgi:NTP pyrophosphatase (non-canonical NTP hydrolase)
MKDFNTYQEFTNTTVLESVKDCTHYFALGLSGEVGEVNEIVKKLIRDGGDIPYEKLTLELGDVLYYLSQVAACFGISMSDVANANIKKLTSRKSRGVIGGSGNDR